MICSVCGTPLPDVKMTWAWQAMIDSIGEGVPAGGEIVFPRRDLVSAGCGVVSSRSDFRLALGEMTLALRETISSRGETVSSRREVVFRPAEMVFSRGKIISALVGP